MEVNEQVRFSPEGSVTVRLSGQYEPPREELTANAKDLLRKEELGVVTLGPIYARHLIECDSYSGREYNLEMLERIGPWDKSTIRRLSAEDFILCEVAVTELLKKSQATGKRVLEQLHGTQNGRPPKSED